MRRRVRPVSPKRRRLVSSLNRNIETPGSAARREQPPNMPLHRAGEGLGDTTRGTMRMLMALQPRR
jgi:hypothetical protein